MMNGQMNGFHNSLIEEDCFLFTSESVGEGHPGKTHRHFVCFSGLNKIKLQMCFYNIASPHIYVSTLVWQSGVYIIQIYGLSLARLREHSWAGFKSTRY